jgi:hypothetical protein
MAGRTFQYLQLTPEPIDEENAILSSNEDLARVYVAQEQSRRRRLKLRIGMVIAAVALLGAAYKATQWNSNNGSNSPASKNAEQQRDGQIESVAKFVDPCAPVTTTTTSPLCAPFSGIYFQPTQACCATGCGQYCGATNCQRAPPNVGPFNVCCTRTYTNICGSAGAVSPCLLPRTIAGAVQLLVDNLSAFTSNPAALAAVAAALAQLLNVPVADITATLGGVAGGRRLVAEAVNVDYVLRLPPTSALSPAEVTTQSANLLPALQTQLTSANVPVNVLEAELPTPTVQEAGTASPAPAPVPLLSTTTAAATTTMGYNISYNVTL